MEEKRGVNGMKAIRVGVVGVGMISDIFIENMINTFASTEVVGCTARNMEHIRAKAEKFNIAPMTMDEMFGDKSIEMIVNLTPVAAHYEIIKRALESGKHVYTEKALALNYTSALKSSIIEINFILRAVAEKHSIRQSDAEYTRVRVILISMTVSVPRSENLAKLCHKRSVIFVAGVPDILANSVSRKPIAGNCGICIDLKLFHFIRKRIRHNIKRAILVISVYCTHSWTATVYCRERNQSVVSEPLREKF
jgi:hypothetical protein